MVGESLENNFIFFHLCLHHSPEQCHPTSHFSQSTIHILRKHIFRLLGPPTYVRGHSTTTWTNFDQILTTTLPRVDKRGHFTYPPLVHVNKGHFCIFGI